MDKSINHLLKEENEQINKLKEIAKSSIENENLIIENLTNPPKELLRRGQKVSDKVARFGGSWTFIISFGIVLFIWIVINSILPKKYIFDAYPFILMNLVLSCIAAIQAPIIMMSQNRQEEKDRKRNENDYLINLKAELEIKSLHEKIDLVSEEQIKTLIESQAKQLEMLKQIEAKIKNIEK